MTTTTTEQPYDIIVEVVDGAIYYYMRSDGRPAKPLDLDQARSALSSAFEAAKANIAEVAQLEKAIAEVQARK
jgi:hypothetical protein